MDNKTVHILLVEDDENHAELVRRAFESRSSEVNLLVVGTLKEARKFLEFMMPQLLITDLLLPDGEGIALLPVPKEEACFPVMVMTSHGDEQRAVEAMKAGALDYVVKTKETLADMPHIAERALREWEAITHRKESEKLQDLQKEILEKIVAGESLIAILNALCVHVETMIPQSVCSIMVLNESSHSLHVLAAPNALEAWCAVLDGLKPGEEAGSCGTAAYTGEPVFVTDTQVDPRWASFRDFALQYGIGSCWSIPIFSDKTKVLGTFAVSHSSPHSPTPFHRQLLELSSYMAGITIQRREAEDRLRASEDQFRDLYDSAPLAYFSATPDGHILMANSKAVELFGFTKEELIGRSTLELYAPTEQGQVKARDIQEWFLSGRDIVGEELEMQRADGSRLWVNLTVRLIHDEKGTLIERRGIVEDISIRRQAEEALKSTIAGTASVTGTDFFRSLVRYLASALNVRYAFVARCTDSTNTKVRTLAFIMGDDFGENVEYALEGTPCQHVISGDTVCSAKGVQTLFPLDQDLVNLGIEGYLGIPLLNSSSRVIGHLAILDVNPLRVDEHAQAMLKIFAARAGAELERLRAEEALQESNERLRALNVQLSAAEEAERKRIARELHDQFGQALTLLKFELAELADCFIQNDSARTGSSVSEKFKSVTSLVDSTIHSVRNISSFLRPPILDDFGLIPALEWLGEDLQERTRLQCTISIDPQLTHLSLNEAQTTTLFRIAQELLTNVLRHAQATHVTLGFKLELNAFVLDVCDNGQGISANSLSGSGSFGLRGIRERAWLLGGEFTLQGQPGKGTTATVRLPIDS